MKLFINVVEEGSFSAAARSLGLTPSAVSRQISQLEEDLGGRLFQRTTRRQNLTEAGEIYFQHVIRIVEDMQVAQKAVKSLTGAPSGTLRITAEADFAIAFIEPVIKEFLERYPDIQISLDLSASYNDLITDNFDLAIRVGHLESSSLVARKLSESRSIICASPDYIGQFGAVSEPKDLHEHNCLSFRTDPGKNYWKFSAVNEVINIEVQGSIKVNSLLFLRKAALNGLGIVMIPIWMVEQELKSKSLIPLLESHSAIPSSTPVNAIYSSKRQLPLKVRVFIDFLLERI